MASFQANKGTGKKATRNRVGHQAHQPECRDFARCGRSWDVNLDAETSAEEDESAILERFIEWIADGSVELSSERIHESLSRLAAGALCKLNSTRVGQFGYILNVLNGAVYPQTVEEYNKLCIREKAFDKFWVCTPCWKIVKESFKSKRMIVRRESTCESCQKRRDRIQFADQLAKMLGESFLGFVHVPGCTGSRQCPQCHE